MTTPTNTSRRRLALPAALLLLLATASGCGVGLPTQPSLDQTTATTASAESLDLSPVLIDEGSGSNNGGAGMSGPPLPPDTDETVVIQPTVGPGNSDWGHGHKKNLD